MIVVAATSSPSPGVRSAPAVFTTSRRSRRTRSSMLLRRGNSRESAFSPSDRSLKLTSLQQTPPDRALLSTTTVIRVAQWRGRCRETGASRSQLESFSSASTPPLVRMSRITVAIEGHTPLALSSVAYCFHQSQWTLCRIITKPSLKEAVIKHSSSNRNQRQ